VIQSGISRVVFIDSYKDTSGIDFLVQAGVEVVQINSIYDGE
jgi:dCMP deaminase